MDSENPEESPDELPEDPFSESTPGFIALHHIFTQLKAAGFTEQQALYMVSWRLWNSGKEEKK